MTDFLTGSKRTVAAVSLALATAFTAGCAGMPRGTMTGAGTIGGAVIGNQIGGTIGGVLGAIGGGLGGSLLEPDCTTKTTETLNRRINGDNTTTWRGNGTMQTECQYSGSNKPGNLNAPRHNEHMQGGGNDIRSNFRPR